MIDSRDIKDLHPCLQRGFEELKRRIPSDYKLGVSSTYRDKEKQNALYEIGRSKPGKVVTSVKGGGSKHQYRLAFDIFENIKGKEWDNPTFFKTVGTIWEEMGGVWGGNWTGFVDRPHLEFTGGLNIKDLQSGVKLPIDAKMKWEEIKLDEKRYNNIEEIPEWAKPSIQELIDKGKLNGNEKGLDLTLDMIRILTILN